MIVWIQILILEVMTKETIKEELEFIDVKEEIFKETDKGNVQG